MQLRINYDKRIEMRSIFHHPICEQPFNVVEVSSVCSADSANVRICIERSPHTPLVDSGRIHSQYRIRYSNNKHCRALSSPKITVNFWQKHTALSQSS